MFTGIIDHTGVIEMLETGPHAVRILVSTHFPEITEGESIAVDGICLTSVKPHGSVTWFEISPETLRLTTAAQFKVGSTVNLEKALRMGDRLGGHLVSGHIDTTVELMAATKSGEFVEWRIGHFHDPKPQYLMTKGSIALNGVSLTVNEVAHPGISLMLVPHTLERTTLGTLKPGDKLNVEYDWMMKVICHQAETRLEKTCH